jgi:hypothetical protein
MRGSAYDSGTAFHRPGGRLLEMLSQPEPI